MGSGCASSVRYILDPKDIHGEDFPGETFRVLKGREQKEYGEYRTRRLVLAAYDDLARSRRFVGVMPAPALKAAEERTRYGRPET